MRLGNRRGNSALSTWIYRVAMNHCLEYRRKRKLDSVPYNEDLTLISQDNFITFNPLLPEVVGASILPGHVVAPHRQMIHRSHVCMAQVTEIDTARAWCASSARAPGRWLTIS